MALITEPPTVNQVMSTETYNAIGEVRKRMAYHYVDSVKHPESLDYLAGCRGAITASFMAQYPDLTWDQASKMAQDLVEMMQGAMG